MFYIQEADLRSSKRSALDLFIAVSLAVQEENKHIFGSTKTAIAYCQDAYEITFIQDTYDIHGKDIDLTARFMSIALEGEVMMNQSFVEQVRTAYHESTTRSECSDVPKIVGPWPQRFKGFAGYISVYKLPCAAPSLH